MPRSAGTGVDIVEDNSPPGNVQDMITIAHDRAIARGEEALGLAWFNC